MRINQTLFSGNIDKALKVIFSFDLKSQSDRFPTATHPSPDKWCLYPSYGLIIESGYNNFIFVPSKLYFQFCALLKRSVATISEHLYDIFPNVDKSDFEVNSKSLEIYSNYDALSSAGMKITPCVWTNDGGDCYPGLTFINEKNMQFRLPLEDAIAMIEMLSTFDPNNMSLQLINIFGGSE